MRRQVLRLVGATAALLALLLGTSLAGVASAASADGGPGTAVNPADARAVAKSAGFRAAAGVGHAAVTWQSGSIAVGGSEYWTWHNAPANAIFEVSLAPHDVEQHHTCFLRVARTWYVKTPDGERQFRIQLTNPANQLQACQGKVLLNWVVPGTSWSSGTLNPGASTTATWKHANPAKVYVVGLNPGKVSTANCAFELTSASYIRVNSTEKQFTFTVKNIGSVACSAGVQLAWLDSILIPVSEKFNPQTMHPNAEGSVGWSKYPLSTDAVYVPGLSLTRIDTSAPCKMKMLTHDFYAFLYADGSTNGWLRVDVKNTGSTDCQPLLHLAKM